jgi:DNA-directed RNA polymerase subunit RPC12/RpoP
MATIAMRRVRDGEVPFDGGTAIQEHPERPVFRGNGSDDYVCVSCGNVLAVAMQPVQMTKKVRIRCARCATVNVAITEEPAGS